MASYQLDQRGSHYDDLRAGAIASVVANVNRDTKVRREPFGALDFMHWNEYHRVAVEKSKPVLLDDPDAQSNLLLSMMFPNRNG
ncbi:hypothetical protein PTE31013_04631 [Pandoraea terrigena]|uniref:Minor tail T domain-containing protein n=2 Tax=Pandoraea terrigena TaxID=2508292 RepID=A0A5E4YLK9_9BURK|nr:hypothetical protein [Pandoraea terrigena]VVE49412.1 hypothetical protein PTE31013_04631 [Pandoraea terrigena]